MTMIVGSWSGALLPYAFLTLGLALCLYLFFTVKREISTLTLRHRKREQELRSELAAFETSVKEQLPDHREEDRAMPGFALFTFRSGMNLTRRTQAMRMLRRGEGVETIAAALGLPRKEVELLVKVQRILTAPAPRATV